MRSFLFALIASATLLICGSAIASDWTLTQLAEPGSINASNRLKMAVQCGDTCQLADELPFKSEGTPAPNGLPDGYIATAANGDIVESLYEQPTTRYAHGILGDAIEAGRLIVRLADGSALFAELPENAVFEDRTPRIADLDGDGRNEVVTILSSQRGGGSIAVFGLRNGKLKLLSQTPYIGRSNRWLNIAAISDLDGKAGLEIAGVWTPHIGGTLKIWTWRWGRLRLLAEDFGYSNHQIGSPEQRLSAVADFNGDGRLDLALPDASRAALKLVTLEKNAIKTLATIQLPRRIDKAIAVSKGNDPVITLGLDDGSSYAVHR